MCTLANVHLQPISAGKMLIFASVFFSPRSSSASKMGKSTMSSADGDNKLEEEPITSRWQAGGSGLSTCHYLHIDISKSPDRPFLRLPQQAAAINPGKRMRGRVKKQSHCRSRPPFHTHTHTSHTQCEIVQVQEHGQQSLFTAIWTFLALCIRPHLLGAKLFKDSSLYVLMVIVFLESNPNRTLYLCHKWHRANYTKCQWIK